MSEPFPFDVFLSCSSKDKEAVRALAERLRGDRPRLWFDDWALELGDSVPAEIDEGLEQSRVLVLCMSAQAFASGWPKLESYTFRFRDPLKKERRFIPLRLDQAEVKCSLRQFLYVDWRPAEREKEYPKLLAACQPTGVRNRDQLLVGTISLGHAGHLRSVAFNPDGRRALSGADDNTVRLWEVESDRCLRVLKGSSARRGDLGRLDCCA